MAYLTRREKQERFNSTHCFQTIYFRAEAIRLVYPTEQMPTEVKKILGRLADFVIRCGEDCQKKYILNWGTQYIKAHAEKKYDVAKSLLLQKKSSTNKRYSLAAKRAINAFYFACDLLGKYPLLPQKKVCCRAVHFPDIVWQEQKTRV